MVRIREAAGKITRDALGLARAGGPWLAARWLAQVPRNARAILKQGNLQPADLAVGNGPF